MDFDLFDDVSGEIPIGGRRWRRGARPVRIVFGLILTFLAVAGAIHVAGVKAGASFRLAGVVFFSSLGAFGLFNLVLLRSWRWPGCLVLLTFVGLFTVRILFGA